MLKMVSQTEDSLVQITILKKFFTIKNCRITIEMWSYKEIDFVSKTGVFRKTHNHNQEVSINSQNQETVRMLQSQQVRSL